MRCEGEREEEMRFGRVEGLPERAVEVGGGLGSGGGEGRGGRVEEGVGGGEEGVWGPRGGGGF